MFIRSLPSVKSLKRSHCAEGVNGRAQTPPKVLSPLMSDAAGWSVSPCECAKIVSEVSALKVHFYTLLKRLMATFLSTHPVYWSTSKARYFVSNCFPKCLVTMTRHNQPHIARNMERIDRTDRSYVNIGGSMNMDTQHYITPVSLQISVVPRVKQCN